MNLLSHYLPSRRPIFSKLTSIHPRKIMQTFNGKLIAEEVSEFDKLQQKIEDLTQQFEQLERQMTAMSEQDKTDYLRQMGSVQLSLQKLERLYSRILSTTILAAIGLASWSVFLGFNPDPLPAKQVNSPVESILTKP
jgi:TolA-binding protein